MRYSCYQHTVKKELLISVIKIPTKENISNILKMKTENTPRQHKFHGRKCIQLYIENVEENVIFLLLPYAHHK